MNLARDLSLRDDAGNVRVVVETPAASRVKYKYNERLQLFEWSRLLVKGVRYPYDYGFLPRTLAEDGDALDAVVWADEGTQSGVVIPAKVIGALRLEQRRDGGPVRRNDRVLVVPVLDPTGPRPRDIGDVPASGLADLEQFFLASLAKTGKKVCLCGWADAAEATAIVLAAEARFVA